MNQELVMLECLRNKTKEKESNNRIEWQWVFLGNQNIMMI